MKRFVYTRPRRFLSLLFGFVPFPLVFVFALAASALTFAALSVYFDEVSWTRNAVEVRGHVVDSAKVRHEDGFDYFLTYRYEHKGIEYVITDEVGGRQWERKPVGTIDRFYIHRNRPQEIRQVLGIGFETSPWIQGLATLFWLPVLGLLAIGGTRAAQAITVRRFGDRIGAEIVAIEKLRFSWTVRGEAYQLVWKTDAGRFGASLPLCAKAASDFEVGGRIWVYAGPGRDWWEGDVGPRAAHLSALPKVS